MKCCFVSAKKVPWRKVGVPGGKIENGETPEECLVQEIQEELGITIEVQDIFQSVHCHYDHGDFLVIGYLAAMWRGEITLRFIPPAPG